MNRSTLEIKLAIILIIAAVSVYINTFNAPFVFDDGPSIVENIHIRNLWPLGSVLSAPPKSTVAGRPLGSLSLALNYAISGYKVWSYHFFNLLVHILAGLTLYGIIRRTLLCDRLRERFGSHSTVLAWAAAAIWLVHPIQTESVTYIVQRTESLMGLFYLLTLYSAIRSIGSPRSVLWSIGSVVCCGLGMGTKEVMVTAPVLVLLYDRAFIAGSFIEALRRRRGLYAALAATWLILAAILWSCPRQEQHKGFTVGSSLIYAANQGIVIVHYLRLVVWPKGLCLDYSWPIVKSWTILVSPALAVLCIIAVTVRGLVRSRIWAYPAAWFLGILAVTSGFVPVTDLAFEHRMYLPLAGLVVLAVAGGYVLLQRFPGVVPAKRTGIILAVAVIGVLGLVTLRRNGDYRSASSIWQSVLDVMPANSRALNNLGAALGSQGRVDEAISRYRKALELNPRDEMAYNNLGIAFQSLGRLDEAAGYYLEALRISPNDAKAHNNLGIVLKTQGSLDDAINHFRRALLLRPDFADVHYNLGNALQAKGRCDEAVTHFNEAIRLMPDFADAHNNLGLALKSLGRFDEAVAQFNRAISLRPDFADAHYNLGNILQAKGRLEKAIAHFDEAVRLKPDFAEAHSNLAATLILRRNFSRAVIHFRRALAIKPDFLPALKGLAWIMTAHPDPGMRDTDLALELARRAVELTDRKDIVSLELLAAACAQAGQFDKAVDSEQTALELASAAKDDTIIRRITEQLKVYRQKTAAPNDLKSP